MNPEDIKALPKCRECSSQPSGIIYGKITCPNIKCSVGGMSPKTWTLLMTPENREDSGISIKQAMSALSAALDAQHTVYREVVIDRDNLQSKLTACEAKLKAAEDDKAGIGRARDAWKQQCKEAEQQLAAATAPVDDVHLEKHAERLRQNYVGLGKDESFADSWNYVLRAARQRGKVSGDAVKLAQAWKTRFSKCFSTAEYATFGMIADSIIAQAAAAETKPTSAIAQHRKDDPALDGDCESVARVTPADLLTAEERRDVDESRKWFSDSGEGWVTIMRKIIDRLAPRPATDKPADPFAGWGKYGTDWMMSPAPMGYRYLYIYRNSAWMFNTEKWRSMPEMTSNDEADWKRHNPGEMMLSETEARIFLLAHPLPVEMQ